VYADIPVTTSVLKLDVQPPETAVFLDGEYLGLAHSLWERAISAEAGEHLLQLTLDNFTAHFTVHVGPGAITYFSRNLLGTAPGEAHLGNPTFSTIAQPEELCPAELSEGLLKVEVEPEGAMVFLDGNALGSADGLKDAGVVLPEGSHRIRVEMAGYQTHEECVQVTCEQPATLDVDLVKAG